MIKSQGGIIVTQYNYTTSLSPERRACDVFKFIITPVNIVGNGNESNISQGYLNDGKYGGGGGGENIACHVMYVHTILMYIMVYLNYIVPTVLSHDAFLMRNGLFSFHIMMVRGEQLISNITPSRVIWWG